MMPNTKSLLSSLFQREGIPLFDKEGFGEILITICLVNSPLNNEVGGKRWEKYP